MGLNIKKIIKRIYQIDFSNCVVKNKEEFYSEKGVSTFTTTLRKADLDNSIIVTPTGYKNGLFYSTENGGMIYAPTKFTPDITNFTLNLYGLVKGKYYKVTVPAQSSGNLTLITDNRRLSIVTDNEEAVIDVDLTDVNVMTEHIGIFRATSNEVNLLFSLGKVMFSNIIIDEVELVTDEVSTEIEDDNAADEGKYQLVTYGIYSAKPNISEEFKGRYIALSKFSGKGINLYYDKVSNEYVLERDNACDILGESFNLLQYIVDININKIANASYQITELSIEPSPNTLKQGYLKFCLSDKLGNIILPSTVDGRITILIHKIY